jgi:integrase/recombinase XerD
MSALAEELADYIVARRRMGFVVRHDEDTLRSFVRFCDRNAITTITTAAVVEWATAPIGVRSAWHAQRFGVVRRFVEYLHHVHPEHEVPPAGLLVGSFQRTTPFLYTDHEIAALMTAAAALTGTIRPHTYRTLIGLIAVTGMRISEALALNITDVDLDNGLITITNTKLGKSRRLPIHATTVVALHDYATRRQNLIGDGDAAFFVSDQGRRILYRHCRDVVARCLRGAGITSRPTGCRPGLHALRHTFAVNTLIDWYSTGADVAALLPRLSTYLGHVDPSSTYWYLTGSPELAAVIAGQLDTTDWEASS